MFAYYQEKRCWPRVVVNAPGKVIAVSRGLRVVKVVPCTVIDISQGGALLEFDCEHVEDEFYLEMDSEPENRATCAVVRRLGANRIGVRFIPLA